MKNYNCIKLNNHFYYLEKAINEPNNDFSSRYFKSIIYFYKTQLKRKNCSFFEILIEYCEMWKSIKEISFIGDKIPIINTKLQRRFNKYYYSDPNFKRIDPFIDFEREFQLYKGLIKFIKAIYSKVPTRSFKLLNESKNIFISIFKNKTSKDITKHHVFLKELPVFIDIINKNLEILHYFTDTLSIKKNKDQTLFLNQMKELINLIDKNQYFHYRNYLLLVEKLTHFNIYLKECKMSIKSKEEMKEFLFQNNLPLCYDIEVKILIDNFNVFNPRNIEHLTFFSEKLYQLLKSKSKKLPFLIFIQLISMFDMILIIRSIIKFCSIYGCDTTAEWSIASINGFDLFITLINTDNSIKWTQYF